MKKWMLIILFLPLILHARPRLFSTGSRLKFQFGGSAGYNLNYFIYRTDAQRDVSSGYQAGVFFRISRSRVFSQMEFNFRGSEVRLHNENLVLNSGTLLHVDKLSFKYHTFSIPLIFGGYAVKKPLYKIRFYNGMVTDFILKTNVIYTENNSDKIYKLPRKEKRDALYPVQLNYMLGAGADIAFFTLDVRYNLGFRNFYKEEFRTQTHIFEFTLGLIF